MYKVWPLVACVVFAAIGMYAFGIAFVVFSDNTVVSLLAVLLMLTMTIALVAIVLHGVQKYRRTVNIQP